jgi:hypothetical protein
VGLFVSAMSDSEDDVPCTFGSQATPTKRSPQDGARNVPSTPVTYPFNVVPPNRFSGAGLYDFGNTIALPPYHSGESLFPCSARINDVCADGNCCFRVMALALWQTQAWYHKAKELLIGFVGRHFAIYQIALCISHNKFFWSFPEWVRFIQRDGTWGNLELFKLFAEMCSFGLLVWLNDHDYAWSHNLLEGRPILNVKYVRYGEVLNHFQWIEVLPNANLHPALPCIALGNKVQYISGRLREKPFWNNTLEALQQSFRNGMLQNSEMELLQFCNVYTSGLFSQREVSRSEFVFPESPPKLPQDNRKTQKRSMQSLLASFITPLSPAPKRKKVHASSTCVKVDQEYMGSERFAFDGKRFMVFDQFEYMCSQALSAREGMMSFIQKKFLMTEEKATGVTWKNESFTFKCMSIVFEGFRKKECAIFWRDYSLRKVRSLNRSARLNIDEALFPLKGFEFPDIEKVVIWGKLLYEQTTCKYNPVIVDGPIHGCKYCELLHFNEQMEGRLDRTCKNCSKVLNTADGECGIKKVQFNEVPAILSTLNHIEERLICPLIPFMCLRSFTGLKQHKFVGHVILVPANSLMTTCELPQPIHSFAAFQCSFKRRHEYKHDYIRGLIRPYVLRASLRWLLRRSSLFSNLNVFISPMRWKQLESDVASLERFVQKLMASVDDSDDEDDDPPTLNAQFDKSFIFELPTFTPVTDDRVVVAPGEGNRPVPMWAVENVEELSFPTLFGGEPRKVHEGKGNKELSYKQIASMELKNVDRRFARCVENIFFKFYFSELKAIHSAINIKGRQYHLRDLTAKHLLSPEVVQRLLCDSSLYNDFKLVRGTFHYWEDTKKDLFAFLRQNRHCPTFFLSLSMADTRWTELHDILLALKQSSMSSSDLSFGDLCDLLKSDPVTCSRYFVYRRKKFFNFFLNGCRSVLGEINDYFGIIEFQHRGSPHTHFIIWLKFPPNPSKMEEVISCIDMHISTNLEELPEHLRDLQSHHHTERCKCNGTKKAKARMTSCAFGFPRPPMQGTIILSPLPKTIDPAHRTELRKKCKEMYSFLANIPPEADDISIQTFFQSLCISSMEEYYMILRSSLETNTVFYKRLVKHRNVNTFNPLILKRWEANMDIQYCLDPYAVATYVASYMCKGNKVMSTMFHRMKEDLKRFPDKTTNGGLRSLAHLMVKHREVGVQEACFLLLGMPFRFASRSAAFVNTSFPENRVVMLKTREELSHLPEGSTDVYQPYALVKDYVSRPPELDSMCLADFASWYDRRSKLCAAVNAFDSVDFDTDDVDETAAAAAMSSTAGKFIRRRQQKIIRFINYRLYDGSNNLNNYHWEKIFLFIPFRDEQKLFKQDLAALYLEKEEYLLSKIAEYSPDHTDWEHIVQSAVDEELEDLSHLQSPTLQDKEETDFANRHGLNTFKNEYIDTPNYSGISSVRVVESEFVTSTRTLNVKQRCFLDHVSHHLRTRTDPMRFFLSGGAGVGKSVLVEVLMSLVVSRAVKECPEEAESVIVIKTAPTGIAAFHIHGTTLHTAFRLPFFIPSKYVDLTAKPLHELRQSLRNVRLIIIDEISMVGLTVLHWVDERLKEIFNNKELFGGKHVIFVGDLYQLPPVKDSFCFDTLNGEKGSKFLWEGFHMFELTEIMRQKDHIAYAELLNRLRDGSHTAEDIRYLEQKRDESQKVDPSFEQHSALHIFTTRDKVRDFNKKLFEAAPLHEKVEHWAEDRDLFTRRLLFSHRNVTSQNTPRLEKEQSLAGLPTVVRLYIGARAQLVINMNTTDGLVNGADGVVRAFSFGNNNQNPHDNLIIVWIEFSITTIGQHLRTEKSHLYGEFGISSKTWTPILALEKKYVHTSTKHDCMRTQFPLQHSNASTVHKVQGLTLKKGVLDLSGRKECGRYYVALSRFSSPDQFKLSHFESSEIRVSKKINDKMQELRQTPLLLVPKPTAELLPLMHTSLFFQNVRSLRSHFRDLRAIPSFSQFHVHILIETQLENFLDFYPILSDFKNTLHPHLLQLPLSHGGILVSVSSSCPILYRLSNPDLEILCFSFHQYHIVVVYRHPKCPMSYFYSELLLVLNAYQHPSTIILGDFNIDAAKFDNFQPCQPLVELGFHQIVNFPTTVYKTCLDHVYIKSPLFHKHISPIETYHSDHIALFLGL